MVHIGSHEMVINSIIASLPCSIMSSNTHSDFLSLPSPMHMLKYASHSAVPQDCYFKKKDSDVFLNLGNWIIIPVKELHLCDKICFGREMVIL